MLPSSSACPCCCPQEIAVLPVPAWADAGGKEIDDRLLLFPSPGPGCVPAACWYTYLEDGLCSVQAITKCKQLCWIYCPSTGYGMVPAYQMNVSITASKQSCSQHIACTQLDLTRGCSLSVGAGNPDAALPWDGDLMVCRAWVLCPILALLVIWRLFWCQFLSQSVDIILLNSA